MIILLAYLIGIGITFGYLYYCRDEFITTKGDYIMGCLGWPIIAAGLASIFTMNLLITGGEKIDEWFDK
jgi:hypothetical protein